MRRDDTATSSAAPPSGRVLRRPVRGEGRVLLGVGAGLARRWRVHPAVVRLALVLALVPLGAGVLLYGALALVMAPDGADEADQSWRAELGRTLVHALIVLAAAAAAVALVAAAVVLAVFGMAAVALVLATAALAALLAARSVWATRLLGATAVLLALPAAAVRLTDVEVAPQLGARVASPANPADVDPAGYRAGAGPLLLDLRDFAAAAGSTTTIRARADLRTLIVALPLTRCIDLIIDHRLETSWLDAVLDQRKPATFVTGTSAAPPSARSRRAAASGAPYSLLAFGTPVAGPAGRYVRNTGDPSAPRLHLTLVSGRSQMIVQRYPSAVFPLDQPLWHPRQEGAPREC